MLMSATENLSIFDPASPSAESIRGLFILVIAITGGILALVEGVLIYTLIRGKRRQGNRDAEPPQVYGSKPIEIAWTAAPALVVFVLILLVGRVIWEVRVDIDKPPAGSKPLYVTVIGRQWWWEYRYETYDGRTLNFTTANELHIPVSEPGQPRPVYLNLQSADVCHSFWVPRLGGKTDLLPGRVNTMWLQTNEAGLHLGQCAEYCGTQHANMLIRVVAESPAEFDAWCQHEAANAVDDASVKAGRDLFLNTSCVNCHAVRGTMAKGTYAPDLTHLMSRQTLASGMIPNTPENLKKWVVNPNSIKPGCLMPGFALKDSEMNLVIDYLKTLK
ncbi:cytochrome c oxidase subunit II [soil metagenome]